MKAIEYLFFFIIYQMIIILCLAPIFYVAVQLSEIFPKGSVATIINASVVIAFLLGMFLSGWLSRQASIKYVTEDEGFIQALDSSVKEGRLYLAFLPVVGTLFYRPPKQSFDRNDQE